MEGYSLPGDGARKLGQWMAGRQWNHGEPEPECFHQGGLEISEIFNPQNWFTRRGVYKYVDIHTYTARTICCVRLLLQIAIFVWLSFFLIVYIFWSASHGAVAEVEMFCFRRCWHFLPWHWRLATTHPETREVSVSPSHLPRAPCYRWLQSGLVTASLSMMKQRDTKGVSCVWGSVQS